MTKHSPIPSPGAHDVRAYCIPRRDVLTYWHRVWRWIDQGYAACDIPMPADIIEQLTSGHMQLWIAATADGVMLCAVLTALAKMRSGLHAQVVCAGGADVERWIGCMPTIHEWAKREGACKVTVQGRPGWAKLLHQYRRSQVILELDLDEQHDRDPDAAISQN